MIGLLRLGPAIAFLAAGVLAHKRRPESRVGVLLAAVGVLYPVSYLLRIHQPVVWTVAYLMNPLWIVVFVYLLVAFPRSTLRTRAEKAVVGFAAVQAIAWNPVILLFADSLYFAGSPAGLNVLMIRPDHTVADTLTSVSGGFDLLALAGVLVVLLRKWVRATPPLRRVLAPMFLTGIAAITYVVAAVESRNFGLPGATLLLTVVPIVLAIVPFGFVAGLLRARYRTAAVTTALLQTGALPRGETFQLTLSRALGDPDVVLGLWSPTRSAYVSVGGDALDIERIAEEALSRVVTYLERDGAPLGVIVHDEALLHDPALVEAVSAATRLAVDNDRLRVQVDEQLEEVRASRARIVQAADEERRRIERNLHDGAQQRLVSLTLALRAAEAILDRESDDEVRVTLKSAAEDLEAAIVEIRDLARGIHPSVLTDEGLAAALESLAVRSPIAVELARVPEQRLPAPVEATAYFVVAEALANAVKHSGATLVTVDIAAIDDPAGRAGDNVGLVVAVADDGVGGAHLEPSGGLRGLQDRVEALGGRLEIVSNEGRGTDLVARIPCASP